jgi:hypothetical protein
MVSNHIKHRETSVRLRLSSFLFPSFLSCTHAAHEFMHKVAAKQCDVLRAWRTAKQTRFDFIVGLDELTEQPSAVVDRILSGLLPSPSRQLGRRRLSQQLRPQPTESNHFAYRSWQVHQPTYAYDRVAYVRESGNGTLAKMLARLTCSSDREPEMAR